MSLAARLERLRRPAADRDGGSVPTQSPPDSRSLERLAVSLGVRAHAQGFLITQQAFDLGKGFGAPPRPAELPQLPADSGGAWVYIDTETTGLSSGVGNLAFMVGVARYTTEHTLLVRQYLLADFAGEAAMLRDLVDWIGGDAILASYNGKCFDLPLLTARLRLHRVAPPLSSLAHLDLMYTVRRAYRRVWPDCRLQTAERRRLGIRRTADLPGSAAPAAWQAWLRRGISAPLGGVLRHNRQDVVSLAWLHRALADDYAGRQVNEADAAAIGRAWAAGGQWGRAIAVWERGLARLDSAGRLALAAAYRRSGRWSDALELWHGLHRAGIGAATLELSKYYEHRARDYRTALALIASGDPRAHRARSSRLRAKLGAQRNLSLDLPAV